MFKLTISNILGHKRRIFSTMISIVLGVAFLAGTFVFNDSIARTFDDMFGSVYARTDAVVRSTQKIDNGQGSSVRGRIAQELLSQVRSVPGVASAAASVGGYARILGKNGKPLGTDRGSPNLGMDISDADVSVWTLVDGHRPQNSLQMAMDRGSFKEGKFALGDEVTVISQQGSRQFELVGVVSFGDVDSPVGTHVALFDLATAESFVGQPGQVDSIMAKSDGTISQTELARRIAAVMPGGTETLTGKQMAADQSNEIKKALGFFNTLLLIFAFIALFVGSFIIYNTFSIVVAQRQRENALLRAIGASVGQVALALLAEALVMGIIGAAVGFGAGFGMAVLLKGMLAALGIKIPSGGLVLVMRTVVVSFAVGIVITVVAAMLPAWRGAKVPPVAAMRDVAVEPRAFSRGRLLWGLGILAGAVALVVVGLTGQLALLGLGVGLLFIALFVLGPLIARPIAKVLGAPLARWRGMAGGLARQNAMRNPKRTARTAAALLVGVALVSAITVFAASAKSSIRAIFGKQFTGDFVVSTQTFGFGGLPVTLAPELGAIQGVAAATGIQIGYAKVDGTNTGVTVIDPATVGKVFDLQVRSGSIEALTDQGLLISKKKADSTGWNVGTKVTMSFLDGSTHTLQVQGVYEKDELAGQYTIAKSLYVTTGGDQYDFSVFVKLAGGANAATVEQALRAAVDPYPTAKLESRAKYIDQQASQIDIFVNLVYGLLALAVIIAVVGIANTLSLSVYERTRELGLLRAVGATRRQVRSMVRWESVITAVLGAVQGIAIGVALGWAVVLALRDQGFKEFTLPMVTLLVVLVLSMVCGVIAAARPARRAAKLNVLEAIHSE